MRNKTARFFESQNTNTNLPGAISDSQLGRIPPKLQPAESYPRQTIGSTPDAIFPFGLDSAIQKREGLEPGHVGDGAKSERSPNRFPRHEESITVVPSGAIRAATIGSGFYCGWGNGGTRLRSGAARRLLPPDGSWSRASR